MHVFLLVIEFLTKNLEQDVNADDQKLGLKKTLTLMTKELSY